MSMQFLEFSNIRSKYHMHCIFTVKGKPKIYKHVRITNVDPFSHNAKIMLLMTSAQEQVSCVMWQMKDDLFLG